MWNRAIHMRRLLARARRAFDESARSRCREDVRFKAKRNRNRRPVMRSRKTRYRVLRPFARIADSTIRISDSGCAPGEVDVRPRGPFLYPPLPAPCVQCIKTAAGGYTHFPSSIAQKKRKTVANSCPRPSLGVSATRSVSPAARL